MSCARLGPVRFYSFRIETAMALAAAAVAGHCMVFGRRTRRSAIRGFSFSRRGGRLATSECTYYSRPCLDENRKDSPMVWAVKPSGARAEIRTPDVRPFLPTLPNVSPVE